MDMTSNGIAPTVLIENEPKQPPRDEQGRFLAGHSVGGRPPGSRNKVSEAFIEDAFTVWQESGIAALRKMVEEEPGQFVRVIASLVPKDFQIQAQGAGLVIVKLSDEDLAL